ALGSSLWSALRTRHAVGLYYTDPPPGCPASPSLMFYSPVRLASPGACGPDLCEGARARFPPAELRCSAVAPESERSCAVTMESESEPDAIPGSRWSLRWRSSPA